MAEEHYTPSETGRILSRSGRPVSERRIRQMLQAGELEGEQTETGRWHIPRRVVHALLEESPRSEAGRNDAPQKRGESLAEAAESVRELLERVEGFPTVSERQRAVWSLQSGPNAGGSRSGWRAPRQMSRVRGSAPEEPRTERPLWKRIISGITGNR